VRKRIRRARQSNSNAALATASYKPDADFNGAAEITIQSPTRSAPWCDVHLAAEAGVLHRVGPARLGRPTNFRRSVTGDGTDGNTRRRH
jgi:hypothetical protein